MVRDKWGACPLLIVLFTILFALSPAARAGTLALGQPQVNGGQYVFPVDLLTDGGQVSALDFRVQFDPQVFQPISAEPGNAALAANKMVSANYAAPGEYVVVMMGLNQTPVPSGHVATVAMQRVGTEELVNSMVSIVNPTLATPDGAELPASGSTVSVSLGGKPQTEGENTPQEGENDNVDPDPASPGTPGGEPAATPGKTPPNRVVTPNGAPKAGTQGMLAGLPLDGDAPGRTGAAANESGTREPEKKGGLQMPIVLGSETPEAGSAARQAAAGATNSPTPRVSMSSAVRQESQTGTTDAAIDEKIESARKENTPPPSAANAAEGGGQPEGEATGMTWVFAGAALVLLLGAAVALRKFSNR